MTALRDILAQMPASICTTRGPRHVVETANDAYGRFIGNPHVIGKPLREVLADTAPAHLALIDRVYESGEPYNGREMPALASHGGNGRS